MVKVLHDCAQRTVTLKASRQQKSLLFARTMRRMAPFMHEALLLNPLPEQIAKGLGMKTVTKNVTEFKVGDRSFIISTDRVKQMAEAVLLQTDYAKWAKDGMVLVPIDLAQDAMPVRQIPGQKA
jgi:hypothetical protein